MSALDLKLHVDEYKKAITLICDEEKIVTLYAPLYKRHKKALLSSKSIEELKLLIEKLEAKIIQSYALYLITRSAQSEKQLKDKLKQRYFTPRAIEKVLSFLQRNQFINDQELLEQKVKALISKGYGKVYIKQKLRAHFDVSQNELDIIFDQLFEEDQTLTKLVQMVVKRKKTNDLKEKQKHYLFLRRKGQSHEIAEKVLHLVYQNL